MVDFGQVAGDHEVPVRGGCGQCRFEGSQGTTTRAKIFQNVEPETVQSGCGAEQCNGSCGLGDFTGDVSRQNRTAPREQCFVAAHPEALTTGEHKPRRPHATMILFHAFPIDSMSLYNRKNKMLANCFQLLGLALLAAPSLPAADAGVTSVVRADARSGRLVRSVAGAPAKPPVQATHEVPKAILQFIDETAVAHNVDPLLVHSVIQVESDYNPYAVSPKGAQGMMQLIPSTAKRFGVANSFDVKENITAGVKYLKQLQEIFKDDRLALAAYNAGEGAVLKYRDIPPYPETEQYVSKVGKKLGDARRKSPAPQAKPAVPAEPEVNGLMTYTDEEGRVFLRTR